MLYGYYVLISCCLFTPCVRCRLKRPSIRYTNYTVKESATSTELRQDIQMLLQKRIASTENFMREALRETNKRVNTAILAGKYYSIAALEAGMNEARARIVELDQLDKNATREESWSKLNDTIHEVRLKLADDRKEFFMEGLKRDLRSIVRLKSLRQRIRMYQLKDELLRKEQDEVEVRIILMNRIAQHPIPQQTVLDRDYQK